MTKNPQKFITTFKKELPKILGDLVVGIYLCGSLTYDAFDPQRSDVDIVVVLTRNLNDKEFKKLKRWYESLQKRYKHWGENSEIDFVPQRKLISDGRELDKMTRLYGGKTLRRGFAHGSNPVTWVNITKTGVTLYGELPKKLVPHIPKRYILNALQSELRHFQKKSKIWSKSDLFSQSYAILTMCRIFYTHKKGELVSKKKAARWCQHKVPQKFAKAIRIAADSLKNLDAPPREELQEAYVPFLKFVKSKVE
ncbi:aminoglycoside adenylyltransferase domain-containing protein [Patescibacteria group bacterium]